MHLVSFTLVELKSMVSREEISIVNTFALLTKVCIDAHILLAHTDDVVLSSIGSHHVISIGIFLSCQV